ncbi:MAG: Adenylate cyclase, class 3 [Chloroflexi bacterium]|nr:MAG: Adenylate cyclase, class 3 [Chloroflexota bacterium]
MDAPSIQYTRSTDGVNIAYTEVGEGPPLLVMPRIPFMNSAEIWLMPGFREELLFFARHHRVIQYDNRGSGQSDRQIAKMSAEDLLLDVDAVLAATRVERVLVYGHTEASELALLMALRRPELVERLLLVDPRASHRWDGQSSEDRAMRQIAETDWDLYLRVTARLQAGLREVSAMDALTEYLRRTTEAEVALLLRQAVHSIELADELGEIEAPALVLWRAGSPANASREVAAGLPNATTVIYRHQAEAREAIAEYLSEGRTPEVDTRVAAAPAGSVRTILFTDLAASTALTQSVGDARAQEVLRVHDEAVRDALSAHDGEEVKHTGDGIMASFGSAAAVEAALQMQAVLNAAEVPVRIGMNAGEPIAENDDYFGSAVQLAARVCAEAEPGQVLASQVVRDLCRGKAFRFVDRGEASLKGFAEAMRLFVVAVG